MAEFTSHLFPPFSSYYLTLPYLGLTVSASKPPTNYIHKHQVGTTSATSPPPTLPSCVYCIMSHHITTDISEETPPSCPALFTSASPYHKSRYMYSGLRRRRLKVHPPMQKAVCCVICPFFMLLEKKKKERRSEAKSVSYLPPVLSCSPLFCLVLATATLLHSLFSLSVSRISV